MVELTKDMETGIAQVDSQHRELVNRLNTVASMGVKAVSKEETQKTLDLLDAYIVEHFGSEEALQKQCGYPKYDWHVGQHKLFHKSFLDLEAEFAANGHSPKYTLDLNRSIINWIMTHIRTADVEFGKYYCSPR
jgi:hemerythrin